MQDVTSTSPQPSFVLPVTRTHTTPSVLTPPTPEEEEQMMFFIGLRFFDEKAQQRILQSLKVIRTQLTQTKGQETNGI